MKSSMKWVYGLLIVVLLLPALCACSQQDGPAITSKVKKHIRELVNDGLSQGIVVALITPDGTTYYSYGKTTKDGDPVDEHTIFEIGSVTKVFTAILLAERVKQGKMALDEPVQQYLPAEVTMPGGDAITLEYLATHRSGLPRMPENMNMATLNPYANYKAEDLYVFLSGYTLPRDPDTLYEYSNLGAGLLGHILSLESGMTYEDLVIEHISLPLGMDDTRITLSEEQQGRFALPHFKEGLKTSNWDFDCLAGCGALRSTAADMARFVAANMGLYETDLYPIMQSTHVARAETDDPDTQIGLSWHTFADGDDTIVWHNGATLGYHSFCGFSSAQNVGVVVLSNSNYEDIDRLALHILNPQAIDLPEIEK